MSGICGVFRFDGKPASSSDLDRLTARLAHLGRDRVRAWSRGQVGLGHLLLRITQEDSFDAQPLHDDDLSLVADLRIDNRAEIAAAVPIDAEALRQMPDSALLLAAYRKWGADCVDHLIGDFAFAIWDARKGTLTLGRDHMGQRHLFYHRGEGFFAFSTEIKGLWALPQVPRVLLEEKLVRFFLSWEPAGPGATYYEGIHAIPGGTIMTLDAAGTVESRRYWEPHADPAHLNRDEAYYIANYRRILGEAVACRLRRAAAPAGLFMGGGFDSGAICALAGPVLTELGRKLIAVSSVMPEEYRGTIRHARSWVELCRRHMPHLDVRYVTRENLDILSGMERGFLATDHGHSPNRYANDEIFRAIAAAGARIVMDGHGGDYTLNPRVPDALPRHLIGGRFRRFLSEFAAMRRHLRQSAPRTIIRNVLLPFAPLWLTRLRTRRRKGLRLFGPTMPLAPRILRGERWKARPHAPYHWWEKLRTVMERILRQLQNSRASSGSVAAAAHGLEFTQPYHDKRVVEFSLAIPEEFHTGKGRERHLARQAIGNLYPPEFQDRLPGNDDMTPDFLMMAKRIEPRVLAEIARMEKAGYLNRYFDFPRMRSMLTRRTLDQHESGREFDTAQALNAFLAARYIEWFRGDNA